MNGPVVTAATSPMRFSRIAGTGSYLPARRLTNADLAAQLDALRATLDSQRAAEATPSTVCTTFFAFLRGREGASPDVLPPQCSAHGQMRQLGDLGVQMVAPRSIIAWAKSPVRCSGTRACAFARISGFDRGSGVSIA